MQAGRSGKHTLDEDPFHQAKDEMRSLVEILEQLPGWRWWRPSYGYGVAFPDGRYTRDAHPAARADWVIDGDDLDRLAERVSEIMRIWRRPGRRFGAEGMEALQQALGLRVEIRAPLLLSFQEEDRKIVELTEDQTYVLSYVTKRRRAAIVGRAGSGKTTLALQVAKRLASGGNRTLLTCFNWRLAEHLQENAAQTPNIEIIAFHGLCRKVAEEAGIPVPPEPPDPGEQSSYYETVLPDLLAEASTHLGPRYAAMVVDEAQDFLPGWWPKLLSLHREPDTGYLFLFSDSNRNLYSGGPPEDLVDTTLSLPGNLRNTKHIHEFVSVFYRGEESSSGRGPSGRAVEILGYRNDDDLARLLALVLKNLEGEGVPLEDIAVLTPTRAVRSALRKRGSVDGYQFSTDPLPGKVFVCTVRGFKGLERPVVILAELDDQKGDLANYLYVGGSRARNQLIVLATEPVAKRLRVLAGVAKA